VSKVGAIQVEDVMSEEDLRYERCHEWYFHRGWSFSDRIGSTCKVMRFSGGEVCDIFEKLPDN
jgi:hypothetical protein